MDFKNVKIETIDHFTNDTHFLPCLIESQEDTFIEILSASGSSIYLRPLGKLNILGKEIVPSNQVAYKLALTLKDLQAEVNGVGINQ